MKLSRPALTLVVRGSCSSYSQVPAAGGLQPEGHCRTQPW